MTSQVSHPYKSTDFTQALNILILVSHVHLTWARLIHYAPPIIFKIHFNIIPPPSTPRSFKWFVPSGSPINTCHLPHAPNYIQWAVQAPHYVVFSILLFLLPSQSQMSPLAPFSCNKLTDTKFGNLTWGCLLAGTALARGQNRCCRDKKPASTLKW